MHIQSFVTENKYDISKIAISCLPLFVYSLSYTSFMFTSLFLLASYVETVQECILKMLFTALFHVISMDKQYKYCPDFYTLAMVELRKKYMSHFQDNRCVIDYVDEELEYES